MTEAIGLLLLEAGRINRAQLVAALESQRRHGGTLGAGLIRVGAIDEEQLTEFLRKRWGVRRVGMAELASIPPHVLEIVPLDMVQTFRLIPAAVNDEDGIRSLTVVMADPSDMHAVEEVSFFTGHSVERALASESALAWALERHYGIVSPPLIVIGSAAAHGTDGTPPPSARVTPVASVVSFTASPPGPEEVAPPPSVALDPTHPGVPFVPVATTARAPAAPPASAASQVPQGVPTPSGASPSAPPLPAPASGDEELAGLFASSAVHGTEEAIPLTERKKTDTAAAGNGRSAASSAPARRSPLTPIEGVPPVSRRVFAGNETPSSAQVDMGSALGRIATAQTREEVDAALLDALASVGPRVALFVIKRGIASGWDVRGAFDRDKVREVCITLDSPSVVRDVVRSHTPYKGPLKGSTTNVLMSRWLGGIQGDVLLVPVAVGRKVVAVVFADGFDAAAEAVAYTLATAAGQAYERLIIAQKQKPAS